MLDTHRLRVFRAVVAAGSINGAAASMGYTSSAISQHLTILQKETGLTLIERRGRGIEPTAAGLRFAEESAEVLRGLTALESIADDLREGRVGSLVVSYFASAGTAWIPPVVAALGREYPTLRLDLRLIELAGEEPFTPDLEIYVDGGLSSPDDGYQVLELLDEPYLVVLPDEHRLAGRSQVPLAALEHEHWVDNDVIRGPCRQQVIDACAETGFVPTFRIQTHDYPTAIAFVAAGIGVTVIPRLGAQQLPPGVAGIPLIDPTPTRRIMLRTRRSVADHPAVLRATELLLDSAARSRVSE